MAAANNKSVVTAERGFRALGDGTMRQVAPALAKQYCHRDSRGHDCNLRVFAVRRLSRVY